MARTKDDVQKAAAAATTDSAAAPKRRGRPPTGAGVKKPTKTPGKRGRPAGSGKPKPPKATNPDGTPRKRGRPPGSVSKTTTTTTTGGARKGSTSTAKRLREFLPAIPAQESTSGADRRRAKMADNKLQMLPDVKKVVNPNDGRRKNKGVASKGATPRKKATSPTKRDSPALGGLSSPNGVDGE